MIKCEFDYYENISFGTISFRSEKKFNIMSEECVKKLTIKVAELNKRTLNLPVIIRGNDESFMTGLDINIFRDLTIRQIGVFAKDCCTLMDRVESSPTTFISAVNGYCIGGGLELVMATDYIIAADDAKFGLPEIKLGLLPGADGIKRLVRCVGKRRSMDLLLTGRTLSAKEALEWGLINEVVPKKKLLARAEEFAKELASKNPSAVKLTKRLANAALEKNITKDEIKAFLDCLKTDYAKTAINAFLNKR